MKIHPTAIVADGAKLADDVQVGPYSIIGEESEVGLGCDLGAHVILDHRVTVGEGTKIGHGSIIGADPHDSGFDPLRQDTGVRIGKNNTIREYVTIHRGTKQNGDTVVGDKNFLMTGSHVGHDSTLGQGVILANNVLLGGHVQIEDRAFLGGGSAFHQFVRVGSLAMVQGNSAVTKNIPPYLLVSRLNRIGGLNSIGLRRAKLPAEVRLQLKRAFRLIYLSELNVSQALEIAKNETWVAEAEHFFRFIGESKKLGICDYTGRGKSALD